MVRPRKFRLIESNPKLTYFKPQGIPLRELEENSLKFEEMEALKLKFIDKLDQEKAAEKMGISRTTFWRVLSEAGKKVTDALITGKAIRIEGGSFSIKKKGVGR